MLKYETAVKKTNELAIEDSGTPKHIGIIMDGNRRWAKERGLTAYAGHEAGVKALVDIIDRCLELGVESITVYALSTENWRRRAKEEVRGIFSLLVKLVREKKKDYQKRGIRLAILGDFKAFPNQVVGAIDEMMNIVKEKERLKLNIALNYGGRDEILRAVKKLIKEKVDPDNINEETFGKFLYTNGNPDPDLIIRTGGEVRLSNFLLWQTSYSELYFTKTLWPDFSPKELDKAIREFKRRERRFGK